MESQSGIDALLSLDPSTLAIVTDAFGAELAGMLETAESLLEHCTVTRPEHMRERLLAIRQGTAGLQCCVENVLIVAALHHGALRLQVRPTALEDWLGEMLPLVRPLVEGSGQTLRIVRRGAWRPVLMDPRRITHVVVNLVMQAAAVTPAAQPIELSLASRKGGMRIAVADRGPLLREPVPARGFSTAEREAGAGQPAQQASTLGLTVSQAIVEAHGGRTGVANGREQGTVFWFELPALDRRARLPAQYEA